MHIAGNVRLEKLALKADALKNLNLPFTLKGFAGILHFS